MFTFKTEIMMKHYLNIVREEMQQKKLKDPIHRNLLARKLRVTQLIINGDKSAETGKFTEALEHYEKS
ncbi:hypothetical protein OL548_26870 [Lysinibacillus sp. MHQ-1]|nr:hypothetical protein OL548_26870 [Lysinibacillus sp. MHQ-1]